MSELLRVEELAVEYRLDHGTVRALDGANLTVDHGEVVGIIGESGSGKSTLGFAIGRLLPANARRVAGDIKVGGRSVFDLNDDEIRRLRRETLGFVLQNPNRSLDPTTPVGDQVRRSKDHGTNESVVELLRMVGLPDYGRVARSYPHEISGGMAQRVAIAMALARNPKLVLADEPTASLDASVRAQVLKLLVGLCRTLSASVVLLSHDLQSVAKYCDRVAVMYGGRIVESGPRSQIFAKPTHPYSAALLRSALGLETLGGRLKPIDGVPPVLSTRQEACTFAPRCALATTVCLETRPESRHIGGCDVICHHAELQEAGEHGPN